ncbi:MAG: hypothetical protein Crog4KO_00580 [Crocinitomicaceae bacterium]
MNISLSLQEEFQLRIFDESYPRIENCLQRITDEQLWLAPNENMVSIGCLIKHLLGNMQQWVYAGILLHSFDRDRDAEFVPEPRLKRSDLILQMEAVKIKLNEVLNELNEDRLSAQLEIQDFNTTGLSAVIHVIEHFSYHTGQIALLTKLFVNEDLGFYDGYELDK